MRSVLMPLVLLTCLAAHAAEVEPRLRHTSYLALLAPEGHTIRLHLQCLPHGTYPHRLECEVINSEGDEQAWCEVAVGEERVCETPVIVPGLHLLELSSGWNLATCHVEALPYAYIARKRAPLHTVGAMPRLYFYVPEGTREFAVHVVASVVGEGLRLGISDPEGNEVTFVDGDVVREERLDVTVPEGMDGRAWSFAVTPPTGPGLYLDDVHLYLGETLPPFAAKRPEWAVELGKRE